MKLAELLAATAGGTPTDWQKLADEVTSVVGTQISNLNSPWTFYQAAIILSAWVLAKWAASIIEPRIEVSLRKIKGQPGLLRVLVTFLRRIDWMIFAILLAVSTAALIQITWPSNAYIVRVAAHLAGAWAVVST
ncbi:MAG: hypothetical protein ACK5JT_13705, partial [Hyphomicrobiaceae bacterium]